MTQWQLELCLPSAERTWQTRQQCVLLLVVIVRFDVRRIESNVRHSFFALSMGIELLS